MEPVLEYFILCENVIRDDSNKISIINIYDNITATDLPAFHQILIFAARITLKKPFKEDKVFPIGLSIKSPKGIEKILESELGEARINSGNKSANINIRIPGIVFDEFGEHKVTFKIGGRIMYRRIFTVTKIETKEKKDDSNKQ